MILLAFLLPVAIYLIVLGSIHRRTYPVVVPGVWDCIGLLAASSGLLLLGGPAILSSLNERWRMFWLLGESNPASQGENLWQLWVFLSVLYFFLIVSVAGYMIWRHRHLTSIYNVEPEILNTALEQIFLGMGLTPFRSGHLYLFGPNSQRDRGNFYAEQEGTVDVLEALPTQSAVLEVDAFPAMRHVTLRWDPAESTVRDSVENELRRVLERSPSSPSDVGPWLTIIGLALMVLFLIGLSALALRWLLL